MGKNPRGILAVFVLCCGLADANMIQASPPSSNDGHGPLRDRPYIAAGVLVAEDGSILRATVTHVSVPPDNFSAQWYSDVNWWQDLHDIGHFNAVRVFAYLGLDCDQVGYYMDIPTLESQLDIMVSNSSQTGMYVIIDNHSCFAPYTTDWATFWNAIAPRYANNTNVIYEIKNEPDFDFDASSLPGQENATYQLIRAVAPDTMIIAWSFANVTDKDVFSYFAGAPDIDDSNTVVGWHGYSGSPADIGTMESVSVQMRNASFPQMMTEVDNEVSLGCACAAGFDLVTWLEGQGISWAWFDGDGFVDAATGMAYGNPGGTTFPLTITWPEDPTDKYYWRHWHPPHRSLVGSRNP